jgi:hypothetical protein
MAQDSVRLISDIGLIDSGTGQITTPPNNLIIGIDLTMAALYKLSDESGVIKGGQFLKGFNAFSLDIRDRFDQSGNYAYTLELKAGDYVVQRKFVIAIRIDLPEAADPPQAEPQAESEHVVSMYVGGQLVVSYRKLHTAELSEEIAAIPRPYKINPYDAAAEPAPDMGFPILGAAVAAYSLIKGLLSKKDSEGATQPVVKKTQIALRFIRIDPSRGGQTATAVISLWLE